MIVFRTLWIAWMIYVGYRGYREFGAGTLRIGEFGEVTKVIQRNERPRAYWAFVIFFYIILATMISLAVLAPAS